MIEKKTAKKKIQKKKICPLNPDLECQNCRWFEMSERGMMRCVVFEMFDNLANIRLNMGMK